MGTRIVFQRRRETDSLLNDEPSEDPGGPLKDHSRKATGGDVQSRGPGRAGSGAQDAGVYSAFRALAWC